MKTFTPFEKLAREINYICRTRVIVKITMNCGVIRVVGFDDSDFYNVVKWFNQYKCFKPINISYRKTVATFQLSF